MSDDPNGSRESIDTSPLTLAQLSHQELEIILSIENQLEILGAGAAARSRRTRRAACRQVSVRGQER